MSDEIREMSFTLLVCLGVQSRHGATRTGEDALGVTGLPCVNGPQKQDPWDARFAIATSGRSQMFAVCGQAINEEMTHVTLPVFSEVKQADKVFCLLVLGSVFLMLWCNH